MYFLGVYPVTEMYSKYSQPYLLYITHLLHLVTNHVPMHLLVLTPFHTIFQATHFPYKLLKLYISFHSITVTF